MNIKYIPFLTETQSKILLQRIETLIDKYTNKANDMVNDDNQNIIKITSAKAYLTICAEFIDLKSAFLKEVLLESKMNLEKQFNTYNKTTFKIFGITIIF